MTLSFVPATNRQPRSSAVLHRPVMARRSVMVSRATAPLSSIEEKPACVCGGGCPGCKAETGIQTKLEISEPGDAFEQEADRVADRVMRMPAPTEPVTAEGKRKPSLKRRAAVQAPPAVSDGVPPIVHDVLRSPGQPLDAATRAFMEPRFGHDFSGVRIHGGPAADAAAKSISARAFTFGSDITFAHGEYSPGTTQGRSLLAHELTHTVQQSDRVADPMISGQSNHLCHSSVITQPAVLQRAIDYDECTSTEETVVLDSHNIAIDMVTNAVTKLRTYNGTTPTDVKTALDTHFHSSGTGLAAWIAFNLDWLKGESDSPTYECEKPQVGSRLGWSMWCIPWTDIELYPLWFAESDIDVRARTMIHEWVHRYGCNFDLGYEWEQGYSGHGTLRSLLNADTWAHFVYDVR